MASNYETIIPKNFVNLSRIAMGFILFQQTDTVLYLQCKLVIKCVTSLYCKKRITKLQLFDSVKTKYIVLR